MKTTSWLLAAVMVVAILPASGELAFPVNLTPGQEALKQYVEQVNYDLALQNQFPINAVLEFYPFYSTMAIIEGPSLDFPDGVELSFSLYQDSINSLELRCSRVSQFGKIAGALVHALSPESITLEDALIEPTAKMQLALANPTDSFEDKVIETNGDRPRVYYAYYPNRYRDGVNWLQMTIIFPLAEYVGTSVMSTPAPYVTEEPEGAVYDQYDNLTHLEIFTTPTPEPDTGEWRP